MTTPIDDDVEGAYIDFSANKTDDDTLDDPASVIPAKVMAGVKPVAFVPSLAYPKVLFTCKRCGNQIFHLLPRADPVKRICERCSVRASSVDYVRGKRVRGRKGNKEAKQAASDQHG